MTTFFSDPYPSWAEDLFCDIAEQDDNINLTSEHKNILCGVLSSCIESDQGPLYANLRGPAGTGKTTLLTYIVLGAIRSGMRVCVTSFTHKACGVLREKFQSLEEYGVTPPDPITLHSLLGLVPQRVPYGEPETFVQKRMPVLRDIDLVIIDECSMLGKELMHFIDKDIKNAGINLLFAGDPYQLRPVGEVKLSSSFKTPVVFKLTEVVRHTGPILDLATAVRSQKVTSFFREGKTEDSEVLVHFSKEALRKRWLNDIKNRDPENTVMLAFTNDNRRTFNALARSTLYGENAPRFMKDDIVLSLSPIMTPAENKYGGEDVLYPNNCDIKITEDPVLHELFQPVQGVHAIFRTWILPTKLGHIFVLADRDEELKYKKVVQKLGKQIAEEVEAAKASGKATEVRKAKDRWTSEYYPLKRFYADVDFRYALTIHKSQGSTYKNVYVYTDYKQGREMTRELLYVAVTRASKELHMVNP